MKRIFALIVMMTIIGFSAFAQKFSVEGEVATNFENISPFLGFGVGLNKIDFLGGLGLQFNNTELSHNNYQTYNTDNKAETTTITILFGAAPKAVITEKLTFSFPILADIYFGISELEFENSDVYSTNSPKKVQIIGFSLDAGARIYYALSKRWDVYTGALVAIMDTSTTEYIYWKNSSTKTYKIKDETTKWFNSGRVELGVRFKIN